MRRARELMEGKGFCECDACGREMTCEPYEEHDGLCSDCRNEKLSEESEMMYEVH